MNPFPFLLQTIIWIPTRILLAVFLHLHISGKENLKGLKPGVIFAMNHVSELDPILLPATLNPFSSVMPMHYVSREKEAYAHFGLRSTLYGGKFFWMWGAYPALVGLRDYEKSLEKHISLLNSGKSVCIYPEGRRSPDAGLQKPKGGVIALAKATGAPIVPVAVSGHFKMSPKEFFSGSRYGMISFGKPITVEELFDEHQDSQPSQYGEIARTRIVTKIANLLDQHMKERLLRKIRRS
jgi:1-acyl-sn-glycerol-3-phosphate acyltransferase